MAAFTPTTAPFDYFDDCCECISVIGDQMTTITKHTHGEWASIYGMSWIQLDNTESITEYEIKINKLSSPSSEGLMYIGIASTDQHTNNRYTFYNDNRNLSYRSDGVIYHNSKYFNAIEDSAYEANDIISLQINPFTERISFFKNKTLVTSEAYNTSSTNCYKLAVSLFNRHDSVSIINQQNIAQRKSAVSAPQLEHRLSVSEDIINDLIESNNGLTTQLQLLRHELASVKQQSRELRFENESLQKQNKALNEYVCNEQNYLDWNVSQVIAWIMSIENGHYLKYFEMLNIKMRDYALDGRKLQEMDYVDIREQLGIIDVDDRKVLYRHIQLLIAKNKVSKAEIYAEGDYVQSCNSPMATLYEVGAV